VWGRYEPHSGAGAKRFSTYVGAHMNVGCSTFRRIFICGSIV